MKKIEERTKMKGVVEFIKTSKDGKVEKHIQDNLIVNLGKEVVAKRLVDSALAAISEIQIGTGTTAADPADTALETWYATEASTVTYEADYKMRAESNFSFTGTVSIREAGLFNGDVTPKLISRVNPSYDFNNGDTLQVIWKLIIS